MSRKRSSLNVTPSSDSQQNGSDFLIVIIVFVVIFFIVSKFSGCEGGSLGSSGAEHVRGYTKKNGTYVAPYTRSRSSRH